MEDSLERTAQEWLRFWQEQSAGFVKDPDVASQMTALFQTMQQRYAEQYAQFQQRHAPDDTSATASPADATHDSDGRNELSSRIRELESRIERLEAAFLSGGKKSGSKRKAA